MKIEFHNVTHVYNYKSFNPQTGIKDINLTINSGKIYALIGATGSGKSTFIQHLNGLLLPSSGRVEIADENDIIPYKKNGKPLKGQKRVKYTNERSDKFDYRPYHFIITSKKRKNSNLQDLRKKLGVVFQFPEQQLFESSVEKDVAFGPRNYKIKQEEAISLAHEALKSINIDESYYKRSPFDLSGGEQRKVAIAGILALFPEVLVLDEPTAGLDPKNSEDIIRLIKDLYNNGKTIILVTHDMKVALDLAHEIIVFHDGEISKQDEVQKLLQEIDQVDFLQLPKQIEFALEMKKAGYKIDLSKSLDFEYMIQELEKGLKR